MKNGRGGESTYLYHVQEYYKEIEERGGWRMELVQELGIIICVFICEYEYEYEREYENTTLNIRNKQFNIIIYRVYF